MSCNSMSEIEIDTSSHSEHRQVAEDGNLSPPEMLQIPQIPQQRPSFLISDILRKDDNVKVSTECSTLSGSVNCDFESDCSGDDEIQKQFDKSRGMFRNQF